MLIKPHEACKIISYWTSPSLSNSSFTVEQTHLTSWETVVFKSTQTVLNLWGGSVLVHQCIATLCSHLNPLEASPTQKCTCTWINDVNTKQYSFVTCFSIGPHCSWRHSLCIQVQCTHESWTQECRTECRME